LRLYQLRKSPEWLQKKGVAKKEEMRKRLKADTESGALKNLPHISFTRNWTFAKSLGG
jgi:hypothetical protein